jgi:hypothetical protein
MQLSLYFKRLNHCVQLSHSYSYLANLDRTAPNLNSVNISYPAQSFTDLQKLKFIATDNRTCTKIF